LLTVYRSVVMFGVIPLFNAGHYDYTWREALVISWGGLRGAVGLALAVAVFGDEIIPGTRGGIRMFGDNDGVMMGAFDDQSARMRYQQIVLLHVSMVVLLTLMINAPTSAYILKKIGLTKLSPERATMLQLAQRVRSLMTAFDDIDSQSPPPMVPPKSAPST
jgi:sodium/hydrogen exchanger 10/11